MAQTLDKYGSGEKLRNLLLQKPKLKKNYCRLCLSSIDDQFVDLFSPLNATETIAEVVQNFAKVTISQQDEYSKIMCFICFVKIRESKNFQNVIENSDFKLRNRPTVCRDPLEINTTDEDDVVDEDSDHEKIDINEIDLKKEIEISSTELFDETDSVNLIEPIEYENVEEADLNIEPISNETEANVQLKQKRENGDRKIEKPFDKLRCSECNKMFARQEYLTRHMTGHTGIYPYYCSFCKKGLFRRSDKKYHELTHTGEANYQCETCGKGFNRQYKLTNHKRRHGGARPYKCDYCDRAFAGKTALEMHTATAHPSKSNETNVVCAICFKVYKSKHHIRNHMRDCHKPCEMVKCEICGKIVQHYKKHMQLHSRKAQADSS